MRVGLTAEQKREHHLRRNALIRLGLVEGVPFDLEASALARKNKLRRKAQFQTRYTAKHEAEVEAARTYADAPEPRGPWPGRDWCGLYFTVYGERVPK